MSDLDLTDRLDEISDLVLETARASELHGYSRGVLDAMDSTLLMTSWAALFHAAAWFTWDRARAGDELHRVLWKSHEATAVVLGEVLEHAKARIS